MVVPNNKVALIVGAGTEIGTEIARGLHAAGVKMALNDIGTTRIDSLAAELSASGEEAAAFLADVSRKLSLQTMLQEVLSTFGRIDILVFIASVRPQDAILDMDEWDWHRTIDLNLTAAFLCMQSVGRVMREIGGGVILNVLSPTSNVKTDSAVYQAAAAGIEALSHAAKAEFEGHGIRVHVVKSAEEVMRWNGLA